MTRLFIRSAGFMERGEFPGPPERMWTVPLLPVPEAERHDDQERQDCGLCRSLRCKDVQTGTRAEGHSLRRGHVHNSKSDQSILAADIRSAHCGRCVL